MKEDKIHKRAKNKFCEIHRCKEQHYLTRCGTDNGTCTDPWKDVNCKKCLKLKGKRY